jgi:hypothetical protein
MPNPNVGEVLVKFVLGDLSSSLFSVSRVSEMGGDVEWRKVVGDCLYEN